MSSRITVNPELPVTTLFKQLDDRPDLQKIFHLGLTKYLDNKPSPALSMFQNILLTEQSWPVWYAAALAFYKLGYDARARNYVEQAKRAGVPSQRNEASVMAAWIDGEKSEAIKAASLLNSKVLANMYHSLIPHTNPADWAEATDRKYGFLIKNRPRLRINYFMTATNLCGGSKVILEHAHTLHRFEHDVSIISFDPRPSWYDVKVPFRQTNFSLENIVDLIPFEICVSGFFWLNLLTLTLAPRTYHFAQGDEMTFGFDTLEDTLLKDLTSMFHNLPNKQLVVSSFLSDAIATHFERESFDLIPNSVERSFTASEEKKPYQIMIMGAEGNVFKNVPLMMETCELLRNWGYPIKPVWVSSQPRNNKNFECEFYHSPPRDQIAKLYAMSEVFLSASDFESSALPILEAMKCRTAVVTSDNGGMRDYVVDGHNALVVQPHTSESLAKAVARVLDDKELQTKLANNGYETSQNFTWELSLSKLEDVFYRDMAEVWPIL